MRTLLLDSCDEKWTPVSINNIRNSIVLNMNNSIEKNIAYNMQYLQFISKQLSELRLTSVLKKMLYKTYIITGMSILEAVFYCTLKDRNLLPTESWSTERQYISSENGPDDNRTRIVSELQKKCDPKDQKQNLDFLINRVKKKKVFSANSLTYDLLENYRRLRNKIHIYDCNDVSDSDYNSFNEMDYVVMKGILKKILSDDIVTHKDNRIIFETIFGNVEEEYKAVIKKQLG